MANTTALAGTTSNTEGNQNPAAEDSGKTFTQEQVNNMLAKERRDTQAKYPDYDKYKQAYDEAQERENAAKSELERAIERANAAEAEANSLKAEKERAGWIATVSKETGVPAAALHGATEEEVRACAESLKEYFAKPVAPVVDTGKPSESGHETSGDPLRDALLGTQ